MKIVHQIFKRWEYKQVQKLAEHGIKVVEDELSTIYLDDNKYQPLKREFEEWKVMHGEAAEFTKTEINRASWLNLTGLKNKSYPQPEDNYLKFTYNLEEYCPQCGIGAVQKDLFRVEDRLEKTNEKIFQLHWVYDEIFLNIEIYEKFFLRQNIGFKAVKLFPSDKVSQKLVQLDIKSTEWDFDLADVQFVICERCCRKKYSPTLLDFFPKFDGGDCFQLFKGKEYFGNGGRAFKLIFISQILKRILIENKLMKWYQSKPVR